MNSNLVALAKELSRTKPTDLPEKFLQLDRTSSLFLSASSIENKIQIA